MKRRVPEDDPDKPAGPVENPTWGPIGSLLRRTDPVLYAHVLAQHEDMVAQERARKAAESVSQSVSPETDSPIRICRGCGVPFEPARRNHYYHSHNCRLSAFRKRSGAT